MHNLIQILKFAGDPKTLSAVDDDFDFDEHDKIFDEFFATYHLPKSRLVLRYTCFGHKVSKGLIETARKEQEEHEHAKNVGKKPF